MKRVGLALLGAAIAVPAMAQITELPEATMDEVLRVTLATTAKESCPGANVNDTMLQNAMLSFLGDLSAQGIDPVAAVKYLETDAGKAAIADLEANLRSRHGVAAEGDAALCEAIRAETAADATLAGYLSFN